MMNAQIQQHPTPTPPSARIAEGEFVDQVAVLCHHAIDGRPGDATWPEYRRRLTELLAQADRQYRMLQQKQAFLARDPH